MRHSRIRPSVKFEDAYYKSSNIILWFGLIIGVFPLSRNSEGTYEFRWISRSTFYSVFIYVLTSCAVTYSTYVKILDFWNPDLPFDEYLFTLIFIVILTPHWLFQVVSLPSSNGIAEYLTMWTEIQKQFLQVTGRTIKLDYRMKFITILSFGTVVAVVSPIAQTVMLGNFTILESVGFYHVLILYNFLYIWWSLQCTAFVCVVKHFRERMQKELKENRIYVDIRGYRYLWEDICILIEKMSSSTRYVYGVYNTLTYLSFFTSVYCAISQFLSTHQSIFSSKFVGFFICVAHFGGHTYAFCDATYCLREEVTHAVNSFLNIINARKVELVVCGDIAIGRKTFTSYVSSMAMYCLVLLQFKITLPQEY